jgi:hypothetical protein
MESNITEFIDMYHSSLDDNRGGYTHRINKYYDFDSGFTDDLIIPLDFKSGIIWDISASTDVDSWSLYLFTKPGMIAGTSPTNSEMTAWAHHIVFASGAVASRWYKYQYNDMNPMYFDNFNVFKKPRDESTFNMYARVLGTSISEFHIRLTVSRLS